MVYTKNLILVCTGRDTVYAAKHGIPVLHLCLGITPTGALQRLQLPTAIRGRLVTYLSAQALEQGSSSFSIPFDRQQLADYLGVDRSALSKELGRMRDEGLLETRKNHFLLHRLEEGDS